VRRNRTDFARRVPPHPGDRRIHTVRWRVPGPPARATDRAIRRAGASRFGVARGRGALLLRRAGTGMIMLGLAQSPR
jgi:hypothetical protein